MLPYELDEVWGILREESPETWKVYCGTRRHMDFETCIAGITYRFNEQFFKELLTPPAIQGRHKLKPPTRKKVRHLFHRMDQLGVMIPKPDLGDLVFYYPKVAAHQSVQNMKGQRGAKEGPDEVPKKPLQINDSETGAEIRGTDDDPMRGPPHVITFSRNTTTTTTANLKRSRDEQPTADCGGGGDEKKKTEDPPGEQRHMPLVCALPQALIYPKRLRQPEQAVAGRMVAGFGEQAQQLLDVLAAAIAAGEIRKTPLDYLQGLVRRCQDGTFDPTPGIPIAEKRNPVQTQPQGPSAREKAAERAMDDRLREYERQLQRPRAP